MKHNHFEILITSPPDRELVVAEIYYNNEQWAEISQDTGNPIVQFYSPDHRKYWEFSYDEAIAVLEKAKQRLLGD